MDFDTLRQIASECGIQVTIATPAQEANAKKCFGGFAERIAAIEREECAKVCESEWSNVAERMYGEECAAAIRSRG